MMILLISVHVLVCLILILVILLQAGRGQGLTGPSFASGNVQSLFGTRAADFLTKATSVAAVCFLFTCIGLDILEAQKSRSLLQTTRQQAPLDMDQIKKALEKVKSEQAGSSAEAEKTVQGIIESVSGKTAAVPGMTEAIPGTTAPIAGKTVAIPGTTEAVPGTTAPVPGTTAPDRSSSKT